VRGDADDGIVNSLKVAIAFGRVCAPEGFSFWKGDDA